MKRILLLVAVLGLFVVAVSHAVAAEQKAEAKSVTEALQKDVAALEQRNFDAATVMHNQTEFVVGFGTLSFINAGLAQSKGRSGLVWWLVSLFLGPIATFLIVVLEKVRPEPPAP